MRRILCVLALTLGACASLQDAGRAPSSALTDTTGTRLRGALASAVAAHPGKSGVYALAQGRDAFAARVLLARAAERSLDVQYYIFRNDTTGGLLCEALWQAAGRGARVRLARQDNNTTRTAPGAPDAP